MDENVNYIALAIPVFFILIGIELVVAIIKNRKLYRLNDAINNLSLGVGQQLTGIFLKTAVFFGYLFLYEHARIFSDIPTTIWTWVALFLGVDFFYYWFHRYSHEINSLWAAHIVHHQSEEYNLSVALRQSWFQGIFSSVFYLPLAIIGFDPIMFLTISSFNTLYQFWIHTRTIGKLGPLEWIFNTPSHHRVHHGSNPKYIDKNHAGTLIIWDRMFGTFQEEEEEPTYGITKPLASWNPVWANFHYWKEMVDIASKTSNWKDKLRVFVKPPGWHPEELGGFQPPQEIDKSKYKKYDADTTASMSWYILFQFVIVLLLATAVIFFQDSLSKLQLAVFSIFVVFTLVNCGGLFENRKWTKSAEYSRIIMTILLPVLLMESPYFYFFLGGAILLSVGNVIWFINATKTSIKATGEKIIDYPNLQAQAAKTVKVEQP